MISKNSVLLIFSLVTIFASSQEIKIRDNEKERVENRSIQLGVIDDNTRIYLRGTFNKWGLGNVFRNVGDGKYVMENVVLYNGRDGMKIASEDWKTVDIGGNGTPIKSGEEYQLELGGENIYIAGLSGQQNMYYSCNISNILIFPCNALQHSFNYWLHSVVI